MSSFGTKNVHHHHPHQLRRQKTCFEVGSTPTSINKLRESAAAITTGAKRGFCLQRQLSVDATSVIVSPAKFVSAYEKNNFLSNSANDLSWKSGSNPTINDRYVERNVPSPKPAVVPVIKKRPTQPTTTSNSKPVEPEFTERHKKAFKDRGNRLNLNIFLSHSTNSQEGSDAESSNESMTILNKENNNMTKSDVQSNCNVTSDSNNNSNNNISNDSDNNNNNNQVPTKKVPDPSVAGSTRRRPPLVRAMSAPIRPKNDESTSMASGVVDPATNKASQAKRKLKKKKNMVSRGEARDDILEEKLDENDNELDDISNSSDSTSNLLASASSTTNNSSSSSSGNSSACSSNEIKKQTKLIKKATLQRPRSAAVGNEVVTLVSLLSSGGSDSEKEDNHAAQLLPGTAATVVLPSKLDIIDFSARHRAPMLRKSGKSVSFQERDLPPEIPSSTKDFSKYRRGSVAPIAARIRSNRPPTAPAGSIYLCDIDINNDDFMKSIKINSNYDNDNDNINNNNNYRNGNKTGAAQSASGEAKSDEIEEIEINYPENVRTPKEKECWKLYQKMLNRGVTVSYDTILRGMLTPTELRIIQKQNESKRNYDVDAAGVCDGNGNVLIMRDCNVNSGSNSNNLNELEND